MLHRPDRLRAVDADAGSNGRLGAQLPGAACLTRHGGGGRLEGRLVDDGDLALDAIEPVVALLVAEVVVAREVPAAPLELEAVRVDLALLVVVAQATGVRLDTAPNRPGEVGVGGQGGHVHTEVVGALGDEPPQLQEALGGREPLDLHGRGGQVERGQLVGGQTGIAERVLLSGDPVAVDLGQDAGHPLHPQRDAHARSSSLSRSKARRKAARSSGYSSWRWICSAVSGRRASSSSAVRLRRRSSF